MKTLQRYFTVSILQAVAFVLAAFAGELGIPVLLVTGDDAICAQVRQYLPEVGTCAVKEHLAWSSVMSVAPEEGARLVGASTAEALRRPWPAPFRLEGPQLLEIVYTHPVAAELASLLPGFRQTGQMSVSVTLPTMRAVMEMLGFLGSYPKG